MAAKRTLLKGGTVLSLDPKIGNHQQADVLIEGAKIAQVGPNLIAADAEVIDATNTVVMPGFVDGHRHLWEGILRNIGVDVPLEGDVSDMFTQMRTVISLQHVLCFDQKFAGAETIPDQITSRDVLSWATMEGARANALDHKTGSLTPGKEADVIMLRMDRINVMPVNDPIGAVVWGMDTSNVDSV